MKDRRACGRWFIAFVLGSLLGCLPATAAEVMVRGRVLDEGGKPLRGATVDLAPLLTHYEATAAAWRGEPERESVTRGTTDEQGAFVLRAPDHGFWKVSVAASGFVAAEHDLSPLIDEATLADLSMLRDARLTVELAARATTDSEPVADSARSGAAETWWIEARSTADDDPYEGNGAWRTRRRVAQVDLAAGRIVLPRVEGESLEVLAWAPGAPIERATGRAARIRLAVDRGSSRSASLLLTEDDGTPIPNALVCDAELRVPIASTDAAGRAQLPAVGAGSERRSEVVVLTVDGRASRVELRSQRVENSAAPILTATLSRARPLAGTVVDDSDSKPLPGAWLWAEVVVEGFSSRERLTGLRGDVAMVARSGPGGVFDLRVSERAAVQAIAPDHFANTIVRASSSSSFIMLPDSEPPGPRIVRLKPWRWVGGVVVDAAGQGIASALVVPFAGFSQASQTMRAVTDPRGAFRMSGFGSGSSKIVVLATGYAPAVESVDLKAASRDDLRIVLRRGNVVRGRVTDFDDQAVAKALVRFTETRSARSDFMPPGRAIGASPPLLTASRGDGSFEIAGVAGGFYDIVVDASGYAITVIPGFEVPAGDSDVDLGPLRVGPGVVIEGVVLEGKGDGEDADGVEGGDGAEVGGETPLAGARILVQQDPSFARIETAPGPEPWSAWLRTAPMREPLTVESDASGRFTLRDVNPSEKVDLRASLDGYVTAMAPGVRGPTEEPVRLVLERGGTIEGTVVDENGEAVARAMVMGREAASPQTQMARGDADGKFTLAPLGPGAWTVEAQALGYERVDDAPVTVEVAAGKVTEGLRIVLREQEHGEVDGRVVDREGVGVADASVRVDGAGGGARTGAGGEFQLDRVPLGTRQITANASRRSASKTIEVREGDNTVELTLDDGVEVSGRVTDKEGNPVAGATVSMRDDSGPRMAAGTTTFMRFGGANGSTDATGAFRLENVKDGAYVVDATLEAKGRARLPGKLEVRGAPVSGVDLVLEKGAVIRGALLGLDIDQLSQVSITGTGDMDGASGRVIGAEYELANLDAGPWRVVGEVSAHGLHAEGRVEVATGEEARLDLDFEGGLTLSGTVTKRRQPASGASVALQGIDVGVQRRATADFEGRFILRGITEGSYELTATSGGRGGSRAPWVRRMDLSADTEIAIELGGGSITGLVLDAESGDPLLGADVRLRYAGPDAMGFRGADRRKSGAAGEFTYEDVPEGTFSIEATKEGYGSDSARVEVSADSEVGAVALELAPSEGLRLRVAGTVGPVPFIHMMAFSRNGVPASAPVALGPGKTGDVFEVPGIGTGSWSVLIGSAGHGTVWLDVEVPGPVRDVALPRASRIAIEIPELLATSALALVEVFDAAGRPFPRMGGDRYGMVWPVESGRGSIENLPPGQWTLRAVGAQGKVWSGMAATAPGETARARLE